VHRTRPDPPALAPDGGEVGELPFIDEHERTVAASASATWEAVRVVVAERMPGVPALLAKAWALQPREPAGPRPLDTGSALPGFRVVQAAPGRSLRLEGRHRFSRYRLELLVDEAGTGSVVRARSSAAFPGVHGAVYRAAVIRSGVHVLAVRRMLELVIRLAESPAPSQQGGA
jgi:hypothetical protein